jgi:hypothetical protein
MCVVCVSSNFQWNKLLSTCNERTHGNLTKVTLAMCVSTGTGILVNQSFLGATRSYHADHQP